MKIERQRRKGGEPSRRKLIFYDGSDASYKTYCRPLRLPYPYRIAPAGDIAQSLRLEILALGSVRSGGDRTAGAGEPSSPLPLIGTSLPPGAAHAGDAAVSARLNLNFVAIEVDLEDSGWLRLLETKLAGQPTSFESTFDPPAPTRRWRRWPHSLRRSPTGICWA